jgi:hypothetical protein
LKKQFVEHCRKHPVAEKRDHKARLQGHRERVSARGAGATIDSDIDSDDTQASLLREFDEADSRLKRAKKELKDAEEGVASL